MSGLLKTKFRETGSQFLDFVPFWNSWHSGVLRVRRKVDIDSERFAYKLFLIFYGSTQNFAKSPVFWGWEPEVFSFVTFCFEEVIKLANSLFIIVWTYAFENVFIFNLSEQKYGIHFSLQILQIRWQIEYIFSKFVWNLVQQSLFFKFYFVKWNFFVPKIFLSTDGVDRSNTR